MREPQTSRLAGLAKEFAQHPAKGLTPAKLARILVEAEQGNLQAQAELFMDMEERDAHLFAEMSKRKRAILGLDWAVEPRVTPRRPRKPMPTTCTSYCSTWKGWRTCCSMRWTASATATAALNWSGRYRGASGCRWRSTTDRRAGSSSTPKTRTSLLRDNSPAGEALQPFGWIIHRPRARSGYVARSGLFRVLAWPYLFRHYATSDLAEMLEIYGLPIRLGKYPPGTADEEKATLLRAVTGLGHAAAGIIPETMAIDFQQAAQGSSEPFLAMMRQSEDAISKAVLGGTLTSTTSQSGGGALPWARCITRFGTTYWHPMPANWRPRCPAICSGRSWY